MTLKVWILRCLRRLFIILVSLTVTLVSEKMLIYTRCILGFMSNSIKKSWKDSTVYMQQESLLIKIQMLPLKKPALIIFGRNWIKGGPKWHRIDECKGRPSAFHSATMVSSSAHWWRQLSTFCRCTVNEKQINRPIMDRLIQIMRRLTLVYQIDMQDEINVQVGIFPQNQ